MWAGIAVFSILIFSILIHEFGHFIALKYVGVQVPMFGIGFGPKLWKRTWFGTEFSFRPFLLGGFVQPDEQSFALISRLKRIIVFVAGPAINLLSSIVMLYIYWVGRLMGEMGLIKSLGYGVIASYKSCIGAGEFFYQVFSHPTMESFMGPIGTVGTAVQQSDAMTGFSFFIIAWAISLSLGVINLLPIPLLDGGQIVATIFRIPSTIYNKVANVSIVGFAAFSLFIAITDIIKLM